ncbi:MAG: gliding motility-associated C-terminal domain-containing protein, partial [Flavobacteriaceae bacterium]|nr:gliding motility-associated C-terminal domain-containing protein [Flavobacteriaceae bacterium]
MMASAQTLKKPEAAPNQTPPAGSSPWVQACASASFNDYWVNFNWSPPLVNSNNEFILELSDADGNFTDPVELAREGDKNTVFDFYFQFQVPPETRGENYRFRVRSTSPALTSPVSDPHPMYYLSVNSGLKIRQQGEADFGDGTAQICDGNSITLEVYDLANAGTYQ